MPLSLSRLNPFGAKKVVAPVEKASDEAAKAAPVSAPAVEVTGTVQEAPRKFESLTGRLFNDDGHGKVRTWAVRVLSVVFVLPVVLAALADLVRGLGFVIGNKYPTVGKIFTGKSFSLIDEASVAVKTAADKVKAVYKAYTTPKTLTVEEQNKQSEQAIQAQVKKLVDGYKDLNGGYLHTNGSFSSPAALKAEKQIATAQKALTTLVNQFVERNATKAEQFATVLTYARAMVKAAIDTVAADEFYIANKVERYAPRPFVRVVAFNEFLKVVNNKDNRAVTANQFIAVAKKEANVAEALQKGVEAKILTSDQAKKALEEQALDSYAQGLNEGLNEAKKAEDAVLNAGIDAKLISDEEADEIVGKQKPEVVALAAAAAKDVAKAKTEKTEAVVMKQIVKAADELIKRGKLSDGFKITDRNVFINEALKQLSSANDAQEAELKAKKEVEEQEALKAKEAADAAEAERVAQVQITEAQASSLKTFTDFLDLISKKQRELDAQFKTRDELVKERNAIINLNEQLINTTVTVKGKMMGLLAAEDLYQKEVIRIAKTDALTDAERNPQIEHLVKEGFDEKTINMINQLIELKPKLTEKLNQLAAVSEKIKAQFDEIQTLIATYNIFAKNNRGSLSEDGRKEVVTREKAVFDVQKGLNTRYTDLFVKGVVKKLRPLPTKTVNVDAEANRAEVEAILRASAAPVAPAKVIPSYNLRRRVAATVMSPILGLWNGGKAAANRVMALRGKVNAALQQAAN